MNNASIKSQGFNNFYPIFDSFHWLERLVPLGIKFVQLRIKNATPDEIRRNIRQAKKICQQFNCQLVVNDYWQLAIEEGCDFVHLGQEDLAAADLTSIKKYHLKLGISTHSQEELEHALRCEPDYIALGPVYPTILKKMVWAPQGLETVTQWKRQIGNIPLVGIGGISLERAEGVLNAGADIVSVVTDISLNANPEERVKQWLALTKSLWF
ncbi:thiamine phosphate synthase [Marinomonas agarivorans]|nr:thiamine phosphate synthase [Marinomonas agarivorans]